MPDIPISALSTPAGFPIVMWVPGAIGGVTQRVAHIYAAGTSGSPDTLTYPPASYPPGTQYFVTDSTPAMAAFVNDGSSWVRVDAVGEVSARVTHSVAQSIATATDAALAFDTERWDTNSIHDTVTNNTRLTCQAAGRYLIIGHVSFDSNATGTRAASIRLNGTTVLANQRRAAHTGSNNLEVSTDYRLVVGDYVEVVVYQDSGVALDVLKASAYSPEFSMSRLAP